MFGDGSRIRKVAIVENGAATLHKAFMEMALGLPYEPMRAREIKMRRNF